MRLPPELQSLVCRDLTKTELKVVRLVCTSFDQAAIPFLFDEVFVAARYRDLEIADLVTSRFGTFVKTITLSFVEYDNISMGNYCERTCDMRAERSTRTSPRMNGHLAHAFGMYSRVQEETLEIISSGDFMAKLCLILRRSPNCRKMILTDCGNDLAASLVIMRTRYALTIHGGEMICVLSRGANFRIQIMSACTFVPFQPIK